MLEYTWYRILVPLVAQLVQIMVSDCRRAFRRFLTSSRVSCFTDTSHGNCVTAVMHHVTYRWRSVCSCRVTDSCPAEVISSRSLTNRKIDSFKKK